MSPLTRSSDPTKHFVLLVHGHPWGSVREYLSPSVQATILSSYNTQSRRRLDDHHQAIGTSTEKNELSTNATNSAIAGAVFLAFAVLMFMIKALPIMAISITVALIFGFAAMYFHNKSQDLEALHLSQNVGENVIDYRFTGGFHSTEMGDYIGSFLSLLDPTEELRPFRDTSLRAATELWHSLERVRPKLIKIRQSLAAFPKPETIQLEIDELTAELQRENDPVVREIRQQSIQSKRDQLGIIQQLARNEKRMNAHHEMVSQKIDTLRSILVANQAEHYLDSPILTRTEEITRGMLEDLHRSEQAIQSSLEEVLTLGRE